MADRENREGGMSNWQYSSLIAWGAVGVLVAALIGTLRLRWTGDPLPLPWWAVLLTLAVTTAILVAALIWLYNLLS